MWQNITYNILQLLTVKTLICQTLANTVKQLIIGEDLFGEIGELQNSPN